MKVFQIIVSAITVFVVVAGGAYQTVLLALDGQAVNTKAYIGCAILGLIAAAKDMRAVMSLPPLSNGNLEAIAQMVKMQTIRSKPNPLNNVSQADPKLFQTTDKGDGWQQAEPKP